ncbi:hypothetical protein GBA63_21685 (plasmid) [Rubrobacter tropicus]|uniref:Uncharacterized protein n=1 Tax=Rubrobacter tropicus TaxID=2653851 RepID=A0A6G8QFW0_9ACTN|nr:hypothetical protein [Rubrobacter tropicus]QIN85333.1 hypothetical protein GBA63_21685 [Rubrobacter tropicus]
MEGASAMVLLATDPMPDYIVNIPLLFFGFFLLVVLVVALAGARKSRSTDDAYGRHTGERPGERRGERYSRDDDIWLASYLSEVHRGQYHGRR